MHQLHHLYLHHQTELNIIIMATNKMHKILGNNMFPARFSLVSKTKLFQGQWDVDGQHIGEKDVRSAHP